MAAKPRTIDDYLALGAAANHCAFYPGAAPIVAHEPELRGYDTSKGTVRFPPGRPLPASLVRTLVKARIAEHARRAARARDGLRKSVTPAALVKTRRVPARCPR